MEYTSLGVPIKITSQVKTSCGSENFVDGRTTRSWEIQVLIRKIPLALEVVSRIRSAVVISYDKLKKLNWHTVINVLVKKRQKEENLLPRITSERV